MKIHGPGYTAYATACGRRETGLLVYGVDRTWETVSCKTCLKSYHDKSTVPPSTGDREASRKETTQ